MLIFYFLQYSPLHQGIVIISSFEFLLTEFKTVAASNGCKLTIKWFEGHMYKVFSILFSVITHMANEGQNVLTYKYKHISF